MSMTNYRIRVTQEQIDTAVRKDSHHCMIADAIQTTFPRAKYILVDLQAIRWSSPKKKRRFVYLTPPEAQQALIAFDQGLTVKPFSFTVSQGYTKSTERRKGRTDKRKNHRRQGPPKHRMPSRYREFGVRMLKGVLPGSANER